MVDDYAEITVNGNSPVVLGQRGGGAAGGWNAPNRVLLTKSGYTGTDIGEFGQPGSNGLALDSEGRLTICQHGNRRVVRIEKNG